MSRKNNDHRDKSGETQADENQAKQSGGKNGSVVNDKRNGKVSVAGNDLMPGQSYELTSADVKNESLMQKVEHGHKSGLWTYNK